MVGEERTSRAYKKVLFYVEVHLLPVNASMLSPKKVTESKRKF
jgi:hypothetical protein